jgi:hypothetical protein
MQRHHHLTPQTSNGHTENRQNPRAFPRAPAVPTARSRAALASSALPAPRTAAPHGAIAPAQALVWSRRAGAARHAAPGRNPATAAAPKAREFVETRSVAPTRVPGRQGVHEGRKPAGNVPPEAGSGRRHPEHAEAAGQPFSAPPASVRGPLFDEKTCVSARHRGGRPESAPSLSHPRSTAFSPCRASGASTRARPRPPESADECPAARGLARSLEDSAPSPGPILSRPLPWPPARPRVRLPQYVSCTPSRATSHRRRGPGPSPP